MTQRAWGVIREGQSPLSTHTGRVAVSPAMGDIGNVLTNTAPQGCTGAKCRQALGSTQQSLSQCPILCDPIDGSPPGSPVPGILQARTLEWVAISFSNA